MPLPVETAAWKDGEALPAGSAAPSEPFRGVAIEAFDSAIPAPSSPHESLVSPTLCLVPRARLPNGKAHRERAPRRISTSPSCRFFGHGGRGVAPGIFWIISATVRT